MYKKMSITSIILLLLCISVSFAWMMDVIGPSGNSLVFNLDDKVYVATDELNIDIAIEKENEFVPLYKYITGEENTNEIVKFDNTIPGDTYKFSVDIKNTSDFDVSISVLFSEIISSHQDFYEYISIGLISIDGFTNSRETPKIEEFVFKDKIENYGKDDYEFDSEKEVSIDFLNNISIPAGEDGVNIKFYIRLSVNASNELQGQTFKIGKINFISA